MKVGPTTVHQCTSAIISILIYTEADKDSTEDEKTETEQPAEKQMKEGPSLSEKIPSVASTRERSH